MLPRGAQTKTLFVLRVQIIRIYLLDPSSHTEAPSQLGCQPSHMLLSKLLIPICPMTSTGALAPASWKLSGYVKTSGMPPLHGWLL